MQVLVQTTIKELALAVVIKSLPGHGDEVPVADWLWTVVVEVMALVVVTQLLLGRGEGSRYGAGSSDITHHHDGGSGIGGGNRGIATDDTDGVLGTGGSDDG